MINFFNYLYQKAKAYNLNISTFGQHKNSDMLKKVIKKGNSSKIFIKVNNQKMKFLIQ